MKLAVAPTLWSLMAKHGAHVIEAFAAFIQHGMFNDSTNNASGVFRPQSQGFTIEPVFKRVHLFLDNIGDLAQPAHKQRRWLDNRSSDI